MEQPHEIDEMGPVDYLVLEFPEFRMTGEALAELIALVDRGVIRILDLVFVRKAADASITVLSTTDDESGRQLGISIFDGASSGLLGPDDIREAAEALVPGSAGGVLVYENLWAAPLARSLRRNGAQIVASGRIPIQGILASLDERDRLHV
jgi:hypothetical protein